MQINVHGECVELTRIRVREHIKAEFLYWAYQNKIDARNYDLGRLCDFMLDTLHIYCWDKLGAVVRVDVLEVADKCDD